MADLIMPKTGPRVAPLLPKQVNADVRAEYEKTVITWGIPNNLIRTMARSPQLALTEVDYANSFIFDAGPYVFWPRPGSDDPTATVLFQAAGFIDPITKELIINLVSLLNRSRYSITHHSVIAWNRINTALGNLPQERRQAKTEAMLLHLVDSTGQPDFERKMFEKRPLYDDFEVGALRFAVKMRQSSHSITDADVATLRGLCRVRAKSQIAKGPLAAQFGTVGPDEPYVDAYCDGMLSS